MTEQTHPVDVHVGKMLRTLRKRAGKSQQTIATHLGITFQQVQKYERGSNRISASKLWEVAEYLGVSVAAFYEGLHGADASGVAPVDSLIAFLATSEGLKFVTIFPRISAEQRSKLVEIAEIMVR